jgi:hypothetical protein
MHVVATRKYAYCSYAAPCLYNPHSAQHSWHSPEPPRLLLTFDVHLRTPPKNCKGTRRVLDLCKIMNNSTLTFREPTRPQGPPSLSPPLFPSSPPSLHFLTLPSAWQTDPLAFHLGIVRRLPCHRVAIAAIVRDCRVL